MTGIVKLNNVTKIIKGRTIIDSISFEVNKGEVFGFLGPMERERRQRFV